MNISYIRVIRFEIVEWKPRARDYPLPERNYKFHGGT